MTEPCRTCAHRQTYDGINNGKTMRLLKPTCNLRRREVEKGLGCLKWKEKAPC